MGVQVPTENWPLDLGWMPVQQWNPPIHPSVEFLEKTFWELVSKVCYPCLDLNFYYDGKKETIQTYPLKFRKIFQTKSRALFSSREFEDRRLWSDMYKQGLKKMLVSFGWEEYGATSSSRPISTQSLEN